MTTLHQVRVAITTQLVWGYLRGGNGRMLGGNLHHAFRATRQTPVQPVGNTRRRYWGPWGHGVFEAEDPLTPLCGRLRSNARFPTIMSTYSHRWDDTYEPPRAACPDCLRLSGGNIQYLDKVQDNDPWTKLGYEERIITPDPVSGL